MKLAEDKTTGGLRRWLTQTIHDKMEQIILEHIHLVKPYYVLAVFQENIGPNIMTKKTKEIPTADKHVLQTRFIIMKRPPAVPLIGTFLWRIDNKIGQAKCIYVLPPDKPIFQDIEFAEQSKLINEAAINLPSQIIY